MANKLDEQVLKEFRPTAAYRLLEERLLADKCVAVNKLKTVDCFDIERIVGYQAKVKYIDTLLRLVDSTKNT